MPPAIPPKPDPCLVLLKKGTGYGRISKASWRRARKCPHGCDKVCRGLRYAA